MPTLSRQQQAEAKRVQIRSESRLANEASLQDNSIEIVRGAGDGSKTKIEDLKLRTSSVSSEDLAEVLHELDAAGDTTKSAGARKSTKVPQNIHRTSHQIRNRPSGDDALTEVLQQIDEEDEEDEEASHGDTEDCDYEEKSSAGDMDTEDQSEDTEDSPKTKREYSRLYVTELSIERNYRRTTEAKPKRNQKRPSRVVATEGQTNSGSDPDNESFVEGFPMYWSSWEKFYEAFADFQETTFQQFSSRTSGNEEVNTHQTKETNNYWGKLLPESWVTYSKIFLLYSWHVIDPKGGGKRSHTKVRATGCTARVNARVRLRTGLPTFRLVVKSSGTHNHPLSPHTWYNYPQNRRIEDLLQREEVAVMRKAGAQPKGELGWSASDSAATARSARDARDGSGDSPPDSIFGPDSPDLAGSLSSALGSSVGASSQASSSAGQRPRTGNSAGHPVQGQDSAMDMLVSAASAISQAPTPNAPVTL
ncbi:unnamed protein product [Phytophthora fragariaefolia]|uniref:Unnamed protein product n=1 Tax=Phytophthora fragariaefolia TaxID=1490495 RepID=A0A9W6XU47_9STRA|nr:unnamed protein product [Phytophthora fragariaefolia]